MAENKKNLYETFKEIQVGREEIFDGVIVHLVRDTVIIPNFDLFQRICQDSSVNDWNDFYVACTRARRNLYLISNYDLPNLNSVTDKQVL